ncbi:hypothetical protein IFO70_18340 [Phormidium tenue FACHB-886]|nr:hypothetical protein [Phormidium tenue FACHB-886]
MSTSATLLGSLAVAHRRDFQPLLQSKYDKRLELAVAPPGALDAQASRVLRATTEAVLAGVPVRDMKHYDDYFLWRAQHLPGYMKLYKEFAAAADQEAQNITKKNFVESDLDTRKKILDKAAKEHDPGTVDKLRIVTFGSNWALYNKYIVSEILQTFAKTDAYIALGHRAWPGSVRGLSEYKQIPGKPLIDNV